MSHPLHLTVQWKIQVVKAEEDIYDVFFFLLSLPVRWGRLDVTNSILLRKPFLKFGGFCFFPSNRKKQLFLVSNFH